MSGARGWALAIVIALGAGIASAATATVARQTDDLEIYTVDAGPPARILFAAPSELATRTLTADDLDVRVDGTPRDARLQRLSASDLEVAVVLDTTLGADALRDVQAAVVELALTLPQGASMRVLDAEGTASDPEPVPGPAIAAIRAARAGTDDALATAVDRGTALLDESPRGRSALLVVGHDLAARLDAIDDRPLRSLSFLVDVGGGRTAGLLGPGAGGAAVAVDATDAVLPMTADIARDLRALYLAEIDVPDAAAGTVTFSVATDDGATRPVRLPLDPDRDRRAAPRDTAPDAAQPAAGDSEGTTAPASEEWLPWLVVVAVLAAVVAAVAVVLPRMLRRATPAVPVPVPPPPLPLAPRRQRTAAEQSPPQRPIAKLTPETRRALAGAYRGLRRLAVRSRETVGIVPDDLFRLAEARASAMLSGHERSLRAALRAALSQDTDDSDSAMVHRAAAAVQTGWQHTARRQSAPPAVVEINALLAGTPTNHARRRPGPLAPVRALDPLVEIGLEHMALATQADDHAALVARAVTVVDVMRAARLARPVLALSQYLLDNADRYRAACRADPTDAEARDDWLRFFFEGIAQRAYVAVEQLGRMHRLRDRYRDAAPDTPSILLVDLLLSHPVVDTPLIARRLAVPPERAETIRAAAEDAGWLAPYPDAPEVWWAPDVLAMFEGRGAAEASTHGSPDATVTTAADTLTEARPPTR